MNYGVHLGYNKGARMKKCKGAKYENLNWARRKDPPNRASGVCHCPTKCLISRIPEMMFAWGGQSLFCFGCSSCSHSIRLEHITKTGQVFKSFIHQIPSGKALFWESPKWHFAWGDQSPSCFGCSGSSHRNRREHFTKTGHVFKFSHPPTRLLGKCRASIGGSCNPVIQISKPA